MIELDVFEARTWFSGKEKELEHMFKCLRVKDPRGYFKAQYLIKKILGTSYLTPEQRNARVEAIRKGQGWLKFYNRRNDTFATGLLTRVKKHLEGEEIPFRINDCRKKRPRFDLDDLGFRFKDKVDPRKEQEDVLCAALKRGSGILHCATNFGKTEVACAIISIYIQQFEKIPFVLFLTHRSSLAVQTRDRFRSHLGKKIGIAIGGEKQFKSNILIATVQTASRLIKKSEFKRFLSKCRMLFIDEMHVNKASQLQKVANLCRARMRFGLSGTINKKDKIKMMHFTGLVGPVIAEVRNKELVNLGRSAKPFIRLIEPAAEHIPEEVSFAGAYHQGIVHSKGRNKTVVKEALRYVDKGLKTLITVGRISHGRILKRLLERKMDVEVPFISGGTPLHVRKLVKKGFIQGKSPVMIASPIFDVGEDLPAIQAWTNASGGKGWELVLQRLGRVLRRKEGRNVVYISDLLDMHNHYLAKHSLARFRYYIDEGIAKIKVIRRTDV
jgi:superfamily II DNA or RNA helicase